MPYAINGTTITIQPSSGAWIDRKSIGISGDSHVLYEKFRSFQLKWDLIPISQVNQLQNFFNQVSYSGTVVVSLPKYANATWAFANYSGCIVQEPTFGDSFEQNYASVVLIISSIDTSQLP